MSVPATWRKIVTCYIITICITRWIHDSNWRIRRLVVTVTTVRYRSDDTYFALS